MISIQIIYYLNTRTAATVSAMKTNPIEPQIVLNPADLHLADRNQPAIMPLDNELATASVDWHAPVYWVCGPHPATVLGALLEQFHGIYYSPAGLLCIQLDGSREFFRLPKPIDVWEPAHFQWLMARVLQMYLIGETIEAIAAEINRQAGDVSDQVAA